MIKIEPDIIPYIKGEKFSNALKVKISKSETSIPLRVDLLKTIVKGKRVIHFGCVDHLPIIDEKLNNSSWLHEILVKSAKQCYGLDNNEDGIEYIKKLGYENVFYFDLFKDSVIPEIISQHWDYILLGEILEHIDNPIQFLQKIKHVFSNNVKYILITVPYAFRLHNFQNTFKHIELINSDHRYWFTPYTLAKILTLSEFEVKEFTLCNSYRLTKLSVLRKIILSKFPGLRDNLLMIATFNTPDKPNAK